MNQHRHTRGAGPVLIAVWIGLHACAGEGPSEGDCPGAVDLAEGVYRECVAELGLEIESLRIDRSGDIEVLFAADSYSPEADALARQTCEPAMEEALVLGLVACETTEIGHPASAARLQEQVERAAADGFSGSVAIVRDGALLWSGGVGLADRAGGIENDAETAYDFGSIMKVMTTAAIFVLEEEGRLSREDRLDMLFADVPADKATITLAQLLAHRAGFREFHDTQGDFEVMDRASALERIFAQELLFAPGAGESYSNSGYTLLAAVVEEVSGTPFPEFLRARLFDVAGMSRTGMYGEGLWAEGQSAVGYDEGGFGCNSPACWPAPSWALMGNGGLVSTVGDLVRWTAAVDQAAYSGRNDFGFGAAVGEVPERSTYVVVAANAAGNYNSNALMAQLVQMSLGALIQLSPP